VWFKVQGGAGFKVQGQVLGSGFGLGPPADVGWQSSLSRPRRQPRFQVTPFNLGGSLVGSLDNVDECCRVWRARTTSDFAPRAM
jgi:hypothetical protein